MMEWWKNLPPKVRDTIDRMWRTWVQAFLGAAGYTGLETDFSSIHWVSASQAATIITLFTFLFAVVSAKSSVGDPNTVGTVHISKG